MTDTDADVELVLPPIQPSLVVTSLRRPRTWHLMSSGLSRTSFRTVDATWVQKKSRPICGLRGRCGRSWNLDPRHTDRAHALSSGTASAPRMIDGTRHENTVADVFTIQDGRVVEMVAYADPDAVPVE
jgi:hypothetical protein